MRSSLSRHACSLCATALALLGLTVVANAQSITYSSQAAFLANVQPGYYLETFDSLDQITVITSPLNFSGNGFSYTASVANDFFNVGPLGDVWLSTNVNDDPITFTFTSGNVTAVGGNFFPTDIDGNVSPGTIDLLLNDGTSVSLTNPTDSTFAGFTSNQTITSLTVSPDANSWATVNNFIVGAAIAPTTPEPGAVALLVGTGATGLLVLRRRRKVRSGKDAL